MKNNFDRAMDYIDANIEKSIDEILKGFIDNFSFNSNKFDKCFMVLTNEPLRGYIAERKLYFVSLAIKENKDRKLCDIAQDFGYSEQSVLNRVMKTYHGHTPGEIRAKGIIIPNNKYSMADFQEKMNDSRINKILNKLDETNFLNSHDFAYLENLYTLAEEYDFDINTTYQIAELAERLEISVSDLMRECFMLTLQPDCNVAEKMQVAVNLGLDSEEDIDEVCEFYQCRYYDLDTYMVYRYFQNIKSDTGND